MKHQIILKLLEELDINSGRQVLFRKKLAFQLTLPFFVIIIIILLISGIYNIRIQREEYYKLAAEELKVKIQLLQRESASRLMSSYLRNDMMTLKLEIDEATAIMAHEITLISPDGNVIYDSQRKNLHSDNQLDKPEIIRSSTGGYGYDIRYDAVSKENKMFASLPLYDNGKLVMIIRSSLSTEIIERTLGTRMTEMLIIGFIMLIFTAGAGIFTAQKIKANLEKAVDSVKAVALGNYQEKVYIPGMLEFQDLAFSINAMSHSIDKKIRSVTKSSNIRQAVLESMLEGVIAIDNDEKILIINKVAEEMLSITREHDLIGRTLQEVVRIPEVQKFFRLMNDQKKFNETEITLKSVADRILLLRGSMIFDVIGNVIGVLVVLNDITELKRLDNLKRDFVANVSHELKTPITTIKGFIETLNEGAINEPENAGRFLEIIQRHADRLNTIVEDLLSLSRLEQKAGNQNMVFSKQNIRKLLQSVIEDFYIKAKERNMRVMLDCDDGLNSMVNPLLIEEAVGNLIDNAIKYGKKDSIIFISGKSENGSILLSVADEGPGIDEYHLPRLFERFYRVDKARSREVGGTGLGLAIVKHIAQVHGGNAEVESRSGIGSIFKIKLPMVNYEFAD